MMKYISYDTFRYSSSTLIENEQFKRGYATILTDSPILLSAPHGVEQTRLGKSKLSELDSARFALVLQNLLHSNLIVKTQNLFDDANFDVHCPYRKEIDRIINEKNIQVLIDFHGLAPHRKCDVNLGVNMGENIKANVELFDRLHETLKKNKFVVSIDQPFSGKYPTISADNAQKHGIFTLQVEINSKITSRAKNIDTLNELLQCFYEVLKKM